MLCYSPAHTLQCWLSIDALPNIRVMGSGLRGADVAGVLSRKPVKGIVQGGQGHYVGMLGGYTGQLAEGQGWYEDGG